MRQVCALVLVFLATGVPACALPSGSGAASALQVDSPEAHAAPLPDVQQLLTDVERNQKKLEALQKNYTYHVHSGQQQLDNKGAVKKAETEDAESLTIQGIRVNRIVARNGKPLTPDEQKKEDERLDKEVAKARERQAKLEAKGVPTDERGDEVMPLSRILELGTFSHPRRVEENGRSLIVLDYAGNPQAKTHSPFEGVMRDVVGTLWIDENDRVLVRAEGHFLNDFKLGGGLLADVRKGASFAFRATRVGDGIWLPATLDGQGSVRALLFVHLNGRMHVATSDYRQFRSKATIVGSHGAIGPDGQPLPEPKSAGTSEKPDPSLPPATGPQR